MPSVKRLVKSWPERTRVFMRVCEVGPNPWRSQRFSYLSLIECSFCLHPGVSKNSHQHAQPTTCLNELRRWCILLQLCVIIVGLQRESVSIFHFTMVTALVLKKDSGSRDRAWLSSRRYIHLWALWMAPTGGPQHTASRTWRKGLFLWSYQQVSCMLLLSLIVGSDS